MPAQPNESNEYIVTSRKERNLKAVGFMGALYMKYRDGEGGGRSGGGEGEGE